MQQNFQVDVAFPQSIQEKLLWQMNDFYTVLVTWPTPQGKGVVVLYYDINTSGKSDEKVGVNQHCRNKVFFLKKLEDIAPFCGATSCDVCLGFQNQGGYPRLHVLSPTCNGFLWYDTC